MVTEGEGPCLVLAGAGSGKTRTLVYRVAYLIEKGVSPENILLVTFTNKASAEMLKRVEYLLRQKPRGLWGGTFHHLGNRILRKYATKLGYKNNFSILDAEDSKDMLKSVMGEMDIKRDKMFPKVDRIAALISFAENSRVAIGDVIEFKYPKMDASLIPVIENIYALYKKKKHESNVMDFDDLLVNWYRLLDEFPEVRQRLSSQFKYILVDEYQDTNKIQGMVMERLAGVHRNILVVGDDAQSIYSFRAATVDNILEFPNNFKDARTFKLEANYRSASPILDLANESIKNNTNQFEKELRAIKEGGSRPTVIPCQDNYKQAEFVSQRILELRDGGASLRDVAVLFRSTYHVLELELELNKRNIPYIVRGGIRFFEQAHIKDVVAFLRIFANSQDELSWMRILKIWPGIGPATAHKIWTEVNKFSSLEDVLLNKVLIEKFSGTKVAESLTKIHNIFTVLLNIGDNFISEALRQILEEYDFYLQNNFENWRDRYEDINQLSNFATTYESLDDFLSDVSLSEGFKGERTAAAEDKDEDYLVLSTIHQAKGLEWRAVFVIHLADGQFPHYKVFDNPIELEEERRLFYVAATRAKEELYLSFPIITISYTTGENINRPSTFLTEISEDLFDKWELEEERYIEYND